VFVCVCVCMCVVGGNVGACMPNHARTEFSNIQGGVVYNNYLFNVCAVL
jgi:hypothetical protein